MKIRITALFIFCFSIVNRHLYTFISIRFHSSPMKCIVLFPFLQMKLKVGHTHKVNTVD